MIMVTDTTGGSCGERRGSDVTIDIPGAFDRFLSGSGEIAGENGETPLYLAYHQARRIRRGRGYSLRLTLAADDAEEAIRVLGSYADTCIDCNSDVMDDPGVRSEVTAAQIVLARCNALLTIMGVDP